VKVLSVVGARPQFVKLAPVDQALRGNGHEHVIVHTGQHYHPLLSQAFFDDLAIPPPTANLGVGSPSAGSLSVGPDSVGPHSQAVQTAGMLAGLDPVLAHHSPDWVLVYGDTTSTLAGGLAAAKRRLRVAHVEAGLRCFDPRMPEELNRILTDHACDLLLAPTATAVRNLTTEGLGPRAVLVGDVMVEALSATRDRVAAAPERYLPGFARAGPYLVATVHRAETTDDPRRLAATLEALASCPLPVKLLAHPRLADRAHALGLPLSAGALETSGPLAHPSMIAALLASRGLITDSGGLQKEALLLGVPCTTLRACTEWPETLQGGWNVLVPQPHDLAAAVSRPPPPGDPPRPYGDEGAAARVVAELVSWADPPTARCGGS